MFVNLPLPDVEGSLREIEYGLDTLKADGVAMYTSYGDKWLGDRAFDPVFDELNRRGAVVYTHPKSANCCKNVLANIPDSEIEYGTDTTRAITQLVFGGTTRRCPNIRFIFSHAGGAVRMRSFGTRDADPFPACIWQVARATSAAPTYFLPIEIDDVLYGDGGTGWNNPTREAIAEARNIWSDRPIGVLVSIGTGLEEALQLNDTSKAVPGVVQALLRNTSPAHAFKLAVAEYAVKCITSC